MVIVLLVAIFLPTQVEAVGTVGNGRPGSCTETALDTRLFGGGLVNAGSKDWKDETA